MREIAAEYVSDVRMVTVTPTVIRLRNVSYNGRTSKRTTFWLKAQTTNMHLTSLSLVEGACTPLDPLTVPQASDSSEVRIKRRQKI